MPEQPATSPKPASKSLVDWPPEPVSHDDAVKKLEKEAEAQAKFNDEMNKLQTEQTKKVEELIGHPQPADDPNKAREAAKQQYIDENDPKKKEAAIKGEQEAAAKRDKAAATK